MKTLYTTQRMLLKLCLGMALVLILPSRGLYAQSAGTHSCLTTGKWLKLTIPQTGVYRVDAMDVAQISGCSIDAVALYGLEGGQLPMANSRVSTNEMQQLPIVVKDANGNGLFDGSDYLLFYAEGASVWRYDAAVGFVEHAGNAYSNYNYCFLTANAQQQGLRMTQQQSLPTASEVSSYTAVGVVDNDETNVDHTGQIWVGERFNSTTRTRTVTVAMPQLVSGSRMKVKGAFAGTIQGNSSFAVRCGSEQDEVVLTSVNPYVGKLMEFGVSGSGNQDFTLTFSPRTNVDAGYLDYLQVNAKAQLRMSGKMLDMWSLDGTGLRRYPIAGSTQDMMVWDVTAPVVPFAMRCDNGTFADSLSGVRHYVAFNMQNVLRVSEIQSIENQDLRGGSNPEMVIVTHPNYLDQAERLAFIHRLVDGMEVMVATTTQVYNEFSSGRTDPMAIRKMMRYFWNRGQSDPVAKKTKHLLLMGRGTYDNRNLMGNNKGCVATYQSPVSFGDEAASYCSDMVLGYLHDNESDGLSGTMDISVGRLPASTNQEAAHLVDKIERYIYREDLLSGNGRGDWRTYVALLADDADPSSIWDTAFASSSEYTATRIQATYPFINVDKIYADSYVQQSGAVGSFYPDATNAVRKRMNYGTLILNYVGHGSSQYIGTERYMEMSDIDAFTNQDRLAFFVGSTCSYGRYDNPEVTSGAEALLLADNAGIGAIAASRPISHHRLFNTKLNLNLLNPENTVGDALRLAQNDFHQSLSIALFGDPALRLSIPQKEVVVTRINGVDVSDSKVDTAMVLSEVTIEGEIRNKDGRRAEGFNGTIYPIVFDRVQKAQTLANDNDSSNVSFSQQKAVLYKGRDTVVDGRWSYTFMVPRDVAYDYDFGRLSHYASSGSVDAAGSYRNIVFGGFNEDADLKETRPEIALYIGDSNFVDGGLVGPHPNLYAVLQDEIGINAFGSGLGHDITAIVDGNPNGIINLNDFYETDFYDAHKGYVNYALGKLASGEHTLTLKAWNIFNYSNSATIRFRVQGGDTAEIGRFYAMPNPAVEEALLHAEFNLGSTIDRAHIDIYDSYGQLIRSYDPEVAVGSYVVGPVKWHLDDQNGRRVNRGIYLARMLVTTKAGEKLVKSTKIVVL